MKKLFSLLLVLAIFCPLITVAEAETITIINCDKVNIRNEEGQSLGRVGCYTPVTVGETKDDSTYVTVSRAYLELSQDNYELDEFINKYSGDISGWVKTRCLSEVNEDMDQVIRKAEEYRWEFWVDGIYHEIKNDAVTKNKSYETHSTPTVEMVPIDSRFLRNSSPNSISSRISKAQKENPNYSEAQNNHSNQSGVPYAQPNSSDTDNNDGVINLNKYLNITISGCNTAGSASVTFDREQFFLDNMSKINYNYKNYQTFLELYGHKNYRSAASAFLMFVSVSLENNTKLSNGDQFDVVWKIGERSINNYFLLDYKCPPQSYTVSNLPEPEAVDPFEGVEIVFHGNSRYAEASLYSKSFPYTNYSIMPSFQNLKNGDTITIKIEYDSESSMIEKYGKFPTRDTMEYTISGIGEEWGQYRFVIHTSN